MPATFAIAVTAHYVDIAGRPARLQVSALDADGGVCWVGRDEKGNPKLRLALGEDACDQICAALQAVRPEQLHESVRPLVALLLTSGELLGLLGTGLQVPAESDEGRQPLHLPTLAQDVGMDAANTGKPQVRVIGAITRNLTADLVLKSKEAATTALIISLREMAPDGALTVPDDPARMAASNSDVEGMH